MHFTTSPWGVYDSNGVLIKAKLDTLCHNFFPTQSGTITVWAIDRYKEISTPGPPQDQLYNKVAGYIATCGGNSATPDNSFQGAIHAHG